jgi:hypothetical protein
MKRHRLLFNCLFVVTVVSFATDGFAQAAQAEAQVVKDVRTGCLLPGSSPGTFVLVDEVTGRRTVVTGPDLGRFTEQGGSRVELTGTLTTEGGTEVFKATEATQTRDVCAPIAYSTEGLKLEVGKARLGVRAGFGMDPELVVIGAQAQLGPIFKQVWFRPTGEFAFGEVTKVFSINADLAYYLPYVGVGSNPRNRWNTYVGVGPSFTVLRRDFEGFPDQPVDFENDWDSEVGFNFIFGAVQSNGLFLELRASAYSTPNVRVYVGYIFR